MEPSSADVEISIVSLGDLDQLSGCLAGLPAACAGLAWRVTVVDNSPGDGLDLARILAGLPAAVVRSAVRRGFAANQNLVLGPVVASARARHVLILNDDTELDPGAVTRLVSHADADPRLGAVGPAIRDGRGAREPDLYAWPAVWEQALAVALPGRAPRRPPASGWLNGAAILARTACLAEVGIFDPSFFLFFEEADLCLRMVRAGWRLDVCPAASLVHHRHGTTGQRTLNLRIEQQMLRSRHLFFAKHHGAAAATALGALSRVALALRAAKAAAAREDRGAAGVLWRLAAYAPSRPSELERLSA